MRSRFEQATRHSKTLPPGHRHVSAMVVPKQFRLARARLRELEIRAVFQAAVLGRDTLTRAAENKWLSAFFRKRRHRQPAGPPLMNRVPAESWVTLCLPIPPCKWQFRAKFRVSEVLGNPRRFGRRADRAECTPARPITLPQILVSDSKDFKSWAARHPRMGSDAARRRWPGIPVRRSARQRPVRC